LGDKLPCGSGRQNRVFAGRGVAEAQVAVSAVRGDRVLKERTIAGRKSSKGSTDQKKNMSGTELRTTSRVPRVVRGEKTRSGKEAASGFLKGAEGRGSSKRHEVVESQRERKRAGRKAGELCRTAYTASPRITSAPAEASAKS